MLVDGWRMQEINLVRLCGGRRSEYVYWFRPKVRDMSGCGLRKKEGGMFMGLV